MKNLLIAVVVILIIGAVYLLIFVIPDKLNVENEQNIPDATDQTSDEDFVEIEEQDEANDNGQGDVEGQAVIGTSAGGNEIAAYHFGTGEDELLFIGGIHGGYSWNTALVAYELVDYLNENPDVVPENVRVTVIPVLNPDGLEEVVGTTGKFEASDVPSAESATIPGRFNANNVDLNRNFDCDWQASGTWQNRTVSGGTEAFSEPESQTIRSYVNTNDIAAVVVWYSAAGGVFASNCHGGVLPETTTITNLYADASGYPAYEEFDFYEITGDMTNWFASNEIPAISVLLTNHRDIEWDKNRAGIDALLEQYAE